MSERVTVVSSSTASGARLGVSTATGGPAFVPSMGRRRSSAPVSESIESAVFAYIQARRHLGQTVINTADIAEALDVPRREVERAAANLKSKGVKPLR